VTVPIRVTPNWTPAGRDDTYHYSTMTLSAFWPQAEHAKLVARWPHLAAEVGATWDEHRRQVERHCALVTQAGHGVNQTPGNVDDLDAFLRDKGVRKPTAKDLLAYPDASTSNAADHTAWAPSTEGPVVDGRLVRSSGRAVRPV
jgi:hypothetical protein